MCKFPNHLTSFLQISNYKEVFKRQVKEKGERYIFAYLENKLKNWANRSGTAPLCWT